MTPAEQEWHLRLARWAEQDPNVSGLIQIGSRVQADGQADGWSDFDFHLIARDPRALAAGEFARGLGRLSCLYATRGIFGGQRKVRAVFAGALEADFVLLAAAQLRIVRFAVRRPWTERFWPRALRQGVADLRIIAGAGWRAVKGESAWAPLYRALEPLDDAVSAEEFNTLVSEFFVESVWIQKRIARGEYLAAQRAIYRLMVDPLLRLIEEEARLGGRKNTRRGARLAERWMSPEQLAQASFILAPTLASAAEAHRMAEERFRAAARRIAQARNWPLELPEPIVVS